MRFEGTYTALVTPFHDEQGQPVDWAALDALVDAQVAGGIAGLVPCGTTGESPPLSHEAHGQVIARGGKRAARRCQAIAGAGANPTREAVGLAQHAARAGADAVMVVVPYYNRPTQAGLVHHFVEVAAIVSPLPVVIYNIPLRTGVDLAPDSLARICSLAPNVAAVKESTGNVLRAQKLAETMGDRLTVLCGDDALSLAMIAVGARGVISVTSNLLPAEVTRATTLALDGRLDEARRAHLLLMPVHDAMFLEANPGPVKAALAMRGVMKAGVRSPLAAVEESTRVAVAAAVETFTRSAR